VEKIPSSFKERFESLLTKKMIKESVPGLSVAIVKEGELVYTRGFGARNLKENLPVTPDTLFGVGSCTKSFTCLAVMQLAEKGLLQIEDPISKYLPLTIDRDRESITIHHLMSMSSGLPNLGVAEAVIYRFLGGPEKYIPMSGIDDLLKHVNGAENEIVATPGERMFYLNSGYTLLGEIVSRVSGKPYSEYVEKEILKPLQMNRSAFSQEKFSQDKDIMTPYRQETKEGKKVSIPSQHPFHPFIHGPGGLLSSAREMANYLIYQIEGQTPQGQKLIQPENLEKMFQIHCETQESKKSLSQFGPEGYGYGWSIEKDFFGQTLISHGGSTGVSSAYVAFLPAQKTGIAAMANIGSLPADVLKAALTEFLGIEMEKFPSIVLEEKLDLLTGNYENYLGITEVSISRKGPLLFLEGTEGSYPLIPENENMDNNIFHAYYAPGQKALIEFDVKSPAEIDLYVERNRFHKK